MKIEAHMMEVHRPQSTSSRALTGTTAEVNEKVMMENSGIVTVVVLGMNIAARMSTMPTKVVHSMS